MELKKIAFYLCTFAVVFNSCKPKVLNLNETFEIKDKIAFGGYVYNEMLKNIYGYEQLNYSTKKISTENTDEFNEFNGNVNTSSNTLLPITDGNLFISVTPQFYTNYNESEALLSFIKKGNTALISTYNLSSAFKEKFSIKFENENLFGSNTFNLLDTFPIYKKIEEDLNPVYAIPKTSYDYFYKAPLNIPMSIDSSEGYFKTLATNQDLKNTTIIVLYEKGRLILSNNPRSFSNYFLLNGDNNKYFKNHLAYSNYDKNIGKVIVDKYYIDKLTDDSEFDQKEPNALDELKKHPTLWMALKLLLCLSLLYLLFGFIRKRREIKFIPENKDNTLGFTEAMSKLYYNEKDNNNLANKMIVYFSEKLRNNYFYTLNTKNDDAAHILSIKTGADFEVANELIKQIRYITSTNDLITDNMLFDLNRNMELILKNKKIKK